MSKETYLYAGGRKKRRRYVPQEKLRKICRGEGEKRDMNYTSQNRFMAEEPRRSTLRWLKKRDVKRSTGEQDSRDARAMEKDREKIC